MSLGKNDVMAWAISFLSKPLGFERGIALDMRSQQARASIKALDMASQQASASITALDLWAQQDSDLINAVGLMSQHAA